MVQGRRGTIRQCLLKIGAQIRTGARKIWVSFSESYPGAELFGQVLHNIQAVPLGAGAP